MDDQRQSQLRLASAKRRLGSFLEQISDLSSPTFPHDEGIEALRLIEEHFQELADELSDTDDDTNAAVVDRLCVNVTAQVAKSIIILGLILRSTNVRNAFELHYALAEAVRRYVGDDIRVLVSSEWTYTPFTWPMNFDILPNFVLIGTPATESSNTLVAPLAGHEIGHTAWRRYTEVRDAASKAVTPAVDAALKKDSQAENRLLEELKLDQLGRRVVVDRCAELALKQIEEIFCDLFGLYLFGSSYLHAYDYLVAPGTNFTTLEYPSDTCRIRILSETAEEWGVALERPFNERWAPSPPHPDHPEMKQVIADVVEAIVPQVRDLLHHEMERRDISLPDSEIVTKVEQAFQRSEPYDGRATLAEIVIAGWRRLEAEDGLCAEGDREKLKVLNDLMLKSIEVTEYRVRTDTNA